MSATSRLHHATAWRSGWARRVQRHHSPGEARPAVPQSNLQAVDEGVEVTSPRNVEVAGEAGCRRAEPDSHRGAALDQAVGEELSDDHAGERSAQQFTGDA